MEHGNNEDKKCCCCERKKQRQEKEYKDLVNRLSRIEGQVRGIKRMVEEDAYCTDILMQVSAVNAALNSFNKVLWQITSKPVSVRIFWMDVRRRWMIWLSPYRS